MKRYQTERTSLLLAALVVMGSLVALLLAADERRMRRHRAAATQFQQLVGGLGLGPATTWEACAHNFDPRISTQCTYNAGPLPGGAAFCPYRTISILAPASGSDLLHSIEANEHAAIP